MPKIIEDIEKFEQAFAEWINNQFGHLQHKEVCAAHVALRTIVLQHAVEAPNGAQVPSSDSSVILENPTQPAEDDSGVASAAAEEPAVNADTSVA